MQASRTFSKCLIWFAALLSPIQALQGTPMFRAVISELQSPGCVCADQGSDANERCECVRCRCGQCRCRVGERRQDHFVAQIPSSPRECPPDCWCKRPAEPQSPPSPSIRLALIVGQVEEAPYEANNCMEAGRCSITHVSTGNSAQKMCIQLCRFLT